MQLANDTFLFGTGITYRQKPYYHLCLRYLRQEFEAKEQVI